MHNGAPVVGRAQLATDGVISLAQEAVKLVVEDWAGSARSHASATDCGQLTHAGLVVWCGGLGRLGSAGGRA